MTSHAERKKNSTVGEHQLSGTSVTAVAIYRTSDFAPHHYCCTSTNAPGNYNELESSLPESVGTHSGREHVEKRVESKITVSDAITMLFKGRRYVTSTDITNCFRHAGFFRNVSTDSARRQADSGSSMINDIDEDYVQIDVRPTTSEIATDEDVVKHAMNSKQVEPDNDNGEIDSDFGVVP